MCGPVDVKGAQPGDRLQIDILSLEPGNWGWAAFLPDMGSRGLPIQPVLGTMGNHPGTPGKNYVSHRTVAAALWITAIEAPMKARLRFTLHKGITTVPSFNVPSDAGVWNVAMTLLHRIFPDR